MTKPVIFLDCDGVLNCSTTRERIGVYLGLDARLLTRLQRLLARVDVEVVLASTWRLFPEMRAAVADEVPIAGETPVLGTRGQEIRAWLAAHPEVERYAIIDDDRSIEPPQRPSAFFTDPDVGLTDEIVEAVVAHVARA